MSFLKGLIGFIFIWTGILLVMAGYGISVLCNRIKQLYKSRPWWLEFELTLFAWCTIVLVIVMCIGAA